MAASRKKQSAELPVLPLRDVVVFPKLISPLLVGRPASKRAVQIGLQESLRVVLVVQRDPSVDDPAAKDLHRVGVVCDLVQVVSLPDDSMKVLVEGVSRVRIDRYVHRGGCRRALISELPDRCPPKRAADQRIHEEALARTVAERFGRYALINPGVPDGVTNAVVNLTDSSHLADIVAAHLTIRALDKQKLLENIDPGSRLNSLADILEREIDILEVQRAIDVQVRERVQKTQKEYFLREQLRVINEELEGEEGHGISSLEDRIRAAAMPEQAETAAKRELARLSQSQLHSPQASVSIDYIETLVSLPWNVRTEEDIDLKRAREVLDRDHYGLDDVKDRVLDYLAVRKLAPGRRGQILCFTGPPGVGKTSIAHAIASAIGRRFVKKSLGGVRDEAEIRGHRRTYVAAMPGGIIKGVAKCKSKNPVFLLDEIDKLSRDFHGDPGAALLEVLDPGENSTFVDHYLEVEFDLSDVFFIATGNWLDHIPPVLRDRMEVINFSGYTPTEKVKIAQRHLLPSQLEEHGIQPGKVKISDAAIMDIIMRYTREAGVRDLRRRLSTLCRKCARKFAEEDAAGEIGIEPADLETLLGPPPYFRDMLPEAGFGTSTGLAWTESGGKLLSIEVSFIPGEGNVLLTGSLGNVMQESARAALTFVKSNAKELGIDCGGKSDVHIHVPEGATPKDGPSAGLALIAALLSAYRNEPLDPKIAFTGEITLRGRVLPIGGLKEKLLAAHREGVRKVIMPEANRPDLAKVPREILDKLEVALVKSAQQALVECGLVRD